MSKPARTWPIGLFLAVLLAVVVIGGGTLAWLLADRLSEGEDEVQEAGRAAPESEAEDPPDLRRADGEGRPEATLTGTGGQLDEAPSGVDEAEDDDLVIEAEDLEVEVGFDDLIIRRRGADVVIVDADADTEAAAAPPEPIRRVGTQARWMDDEPVYTVAFTPDARLAISAGESSVIYVREVETGAIVARLLGHGGGGVSDLEIDVTGSRVISGGYDDTARLWDLNAHQLIRTLEPGGGTIYHAAFDASGRRGITAGGMDEILVWDLDTGEVLKRFSLASTVDGADLSRDGRWIAGVNDDGLLRMWDYATEEVLLDVRAHTGAAGEVIFLEDATRMLTCGGDGMIKIWDSRTGKLVREWKAHDARISEVAVSPDGRTVATGGWNGYVRHWRIDTGERLWDQFGHKDLVVAMAFTKDGRYVASGARDGATRLWDARTGKPVQLRPDPTEGHRGAVSDLLYAGGRLVSAGADGTIRIWDDEGTAWTALLESEGAGVECLALHPDGVHLVAGATDGTIRVWDLASGRELRVIAAHERKVSDLVLVDNGRTAFSVGEDGTYRRTDLTKGRALDAGQPASRYVKLAVSPDEQSVAAFRLDGGVDFLTPTGVVDRTLEVDAPVGEAFIAWHPDGQTLLVPSSPGAIRFDAWSGERVLSYAHRGDATAIAMTSDGRSLVLVSGGGRVTLHDLSSGKRVRVLGSHKGTAMCVAVSPDGRIVATGGKDGAIYLWRTSDGDG